LPVGTVMKVGNGKDLFLNIRIKPAADLSKLEEVLVLVEKQERQATAEDSVRLRASDILAQRLPSVPDKPAGSPSASGVAPPATTAATALATSPKPENKQLVGTVPKPAGSAGATKPITTTPKVTTPSSSGALTNGTNPAGANPVPVRHVPLVPQPKKQADSDSTPPKAADGDGTAITMQPETQTAAPQKKAAEPSSPPVNPQPPADENKPQ
jgi:hypothetical protein